MNSESRTYQIIIVAATLAAAVLPTWVAVKTFQEQAPERGVEIITTLISPTSTLGAPQNSMELNLVVGDNRYRDITIASVQVRNKGSSPITDNEVKVPLTGVAPEGWKIVGIGEFPFTAGSTSSIKWEINGASKIIALAPFLLNAKESYIFPIYLSRTESKKTDNKEMLQIQWTARVVGMKSIESKTYYQPDATYATSLSDYGYSPVVFLTTRAVAILLVLAAVILYIYFDLLFRLVIGQSATPKQVGLFIFGAGLAFSGAEVITSMIEANGLVIQEGAELLIALNVAIVSAASIFGLALLYRVRKKTQVVAPDTEDLSSGRHPTKGGSTDA